MYRLPVCRVASVREGTLNAETRPIRNPGDAATIARAIIGDADREHVAALLLDVKHRVIAVHLVAVAALDHAHVHPRDVFKCAILAKRRGARPRACAPVGRPGTLPRRR
ncbi:MAG TPA: JAB domain-containing protein [bacterium]|nr:JAB domain-containing protein [bacterium]